MCLYKHLTGSEREQIFLLHNQGESIREFATVLNVTLLQSVVNWRETLKKKIIHLRLFNQNIQKGNRIADYRAIYRGDFNEKNLKHDHRGAIRKL